MIKDQVETEAAVKLEGKDNIVQWLVRWGAMVPSRFLVGKDGKTPFERRRGRPCNIPTEKFGEKVWFKGLRTKSELRPCKKLQRDPDWDSRGSSESMGH